MTIRTAFEKISEGLIEALEGVRQDRYPYPDVETAIASDWAALGDDMSVAMGKVEARLSATETTPVRAPRGSRCGDPSGRKCCDGFKP